MTVLFIILAGFLLLQSLVALASGVRFYRYARRCRKPCASSHTPEVSVILPTKGVPPNFKEHLSRFLTQDYPAYRLFVAVADREDPAFRFLEDYRKENRENFSPGLLSLRTVIAEPSEIRGEKVNNSLAALAHVPETTEVLVFTDADALPEPDWLRCLVGPLEDSALTVSTGFRWYLPGPSFVSQLRAAWDTSIATYMGDHNHNFAWGGSMAIRRTEFERCNINAAWQRTVSDDYALTDAVRRAGGVIRFEPRCLLASHEDSSLGNFLRWTNRQIIITRVYAAHLWRMGLLACLNYCLTFLVGFLLIARSLLERPMQGGAAGSVAGVLILIQLLGMAKGMIRQQVAAMKFPEKRGSLARYGSCYWRLAPLVPWVMAYNFITAGFTRRIEWSGVQYELRSPEEVAVLERSSH